MNASHNEERYVSEKEIENGIFEIGDELSEPLRRRAKRYRRSHARAKDS